MVRMWSGRAFQVAGPACENAGKLLVNARSSKQTTGLPTAGRRIVVDFVRDVHALEDGSEKLSYETGALDLHQDVVLA